MDIRSTIKRAANHERLLLTPLPDHLLASKPEILRNSYALLLAAMLCAQKRISDSQTQLFLLLLNALKLGDIRGSLFERSQQLDEATVLDAARMVRDGGFAHHLLVDAFVLLRLDAPLDDEMVELIEEMASLLNLDSQSIRKSARLAASILGLIANRSDENAQKWPGFYAGIRKSAPARSAQVYETRTKH